jgi:hypothetical protein
MHHHNAQPSDWVVLDREWKSFRNASICNGAEAYWAHPIPYSRHGKSLIHQQSDEAFMQYQVPYNNKLATDSIIAVTTL